MRKILLIDDEEGNVRVLSLSLKSDGYDVVTAHSGEEGINVFHKESPDIVLTDLKMPGMNGLEVLKQIKESKSETEVIIITGHGDIDSAVEALQYGASDFINKPIRDEGLSIALKRATEKIDIRFKLKQYTENLEHMVKEATDEVWRKSNFQIRLIRSSNDGIVATDSEWKVVIYNPEAERIFGYPPSEVIGKKSIDDIYPVEITNVLMNEMALGQNKKGQPWIETMVLKRDGESIPARFSGSLLYEKGKVMGSVAFFQDLREIKRLETELVKSESLAAVGETVAGLAHYIKNILIGLEGGSYVVDVGLDRNDTDKLRTGWQSIQRNIGRISDLVFDLLTYSKKREPELQSCFPNEIANDVCELVEERAKENDIRIYKAFDLTIDEVVLDPRTVHRSLLNLVTNAIDACSFDEDTGKNWEICVKTARENGNILRVEVEDNGAGMEQETKDKLFTSFFSTKGGRGTGIGLLVTKKLIEEHGGTIEFTSQPGKGTMFILRLPYEELKTL